MWWDELHAPLAARLAELSGDHGSPADAVPVLDAFRAPIEMSREHTDCSAYEFSAARPRS